MENRIILDGHFAHAIVHVDPTQLEALRSAIRNVPDSIVLEARLVNDLVNRLINQFASFPILVAALALFTGGVVIANSVVLGTMERRREIGTLKAIGVQRERVLGMLLLEYGLLGLLGGVIGMGIGVGALTVIANQLFNHMAITLPYAIALALLGLCVFISILATIITGWGASGEKPLNVLRYE